MEQTNEKENKKTTTKKKTTVSKATTEKKATVSKTTTAKKATASKTATAKKTTTSKTTTAKKATASKTATAKKTTTSKTATAKKATASKTATAKKTTASKTATAKKTTTSKTATAKKATASKTATAKKTTTSKTATAKKATASKTATAKKAAASKTPTVKKATASKTATAKKATASKTATVRKAATKKVTTTVASIVPDNVVEENIDLNKILEINENTRPLEYYDLPYRYNQTLIKILAQTPHSLFLYWDISDEDRQNLVNKYGDDFFYKTKPVLLVHNKTQNYSFEVEVDDFTNSWYLRTPTSNCSFEVELGRKAINSYKSNDNFGSADNRLHISVSNVIESPNDHIIDDFPRSIFFKNVKTNELEERRVNSLSNIKKIYKDYDFDNTFIHNPSSNFKI